ncbi:hypothetical protein L873DRAFT_1039087 [Choiromyces venosus 120613-1]|uniref:Restriction endonuclease domain-containing protein n=1 Tax=Choiromyces venosus 120613-1 TaxID=1336337 RepID=A0A3N4JJC1_9PEZI|nr:hypothetical protein L873DRAFT_1039087 [Choiromyces venosus 120613-1]
MASKLFSTIVKAIKSGEPELLEFADLPPEDSTLVLESLFDPINHFEDYNFRVHFSAPDRHLRVVMPSYLHEAAGGWLVRQHGRWRARGLIDDAADEAIVMLPSPRVTNFIGQYAGSVKEPDFSFIPVDPNGLPREFPSVILESGWASTIPDLVDDCRVWHQGSGKCVRVVILVKTYKPNTQNQVRATLEVSHTRPGAVVTVTQMSVFPIPNALLPDPTITMEELFGGLCPAGHNPATALPLEVGQLRQILEQCIIGAGYIPA